MHDFIDATHIPNPATVDYFIGKFSREICSAQESTEKSVIESKSTSLHRTKNEKEKKNENRIERIQMKHSISMFRVPYIDIANIVHFFMTFACIASINFHFLWTIFSRIVCASCNRLNSMLLHERFVSGWHEHEYEHEHEYHTDVHIHIPIHIESIQKNWNDIKRWSYCKLQSCVSKLNLLPRMKWIVANYH